ncbi:phage major capsid protein [Anaerocolumna chitinilytica]|uniref:Phage capsid-like C-terminal domain-containing protein n=1 Tax=Anaerocolumna chitinilytica TaxID=1727145 RepID=A0A7M3S9Z9_9FIRM|nr:phage major capsid protein [Anaerocolumna chitinilytica]BCK01417.1 hypothetical protein bsdcttw_44570 [Anaerocolumna chitinilytica]
MRTLEEINRRLAAIKVELGQEGSDIDALEKEIKELTEERKGILEKAEKRKKLLDGIAGMDGANVIIPMGELGDEQRKSELTGENVLKSKEYRNAWAKTLMCLPLNESEKRALGTALTTTATSYTAAASGADGVNNGGLFIPEDVSLELMNELSLASPFFNDIAKTGVSGYIKFPYRESGSGAEKQTEGTANKDGQVKWAELTLTLLEVSETIRVTWKLEAMSVDGFIDYITKELADQVTEKMLTEVFYGNGSNTLTGVTENAIDGTYTIGTLEGNVPDVLGGLEAGLKKLPKKKKIGAKIYVAQDIIETISFMRDKNNNFIYNPLNAGGINSVATYKVEVDPYLNAGEFIIGNPRFYRFNTNEAFSITKDISGKSRINDYTAYAVVSGAAQPNSFVHGKNSASV